MRLPNGFGSVYKLSGKRRRPWVARVTVDWDWREEERVVYPVYRYIGYYRTRKEAMDALIAYNKSPYDIDYSGMTLKDCYEKWAAEHYPKVPASENAYRSSYAVCKSIENMRIADIKLDHLQMAIDNSGKHTPTLKRTKVVLQGIFDWAYKHELISRERHDVVRYLDVTRAGNVNEKKHQPIPTEVVNRLWQQEHTLAIDTMLILIYTGVRIGELLELRKENIDLDAHCFEVVRSKTRSGLRTVPIADKIYPLFVRVYEQSQTDRFLSFPDFPDVKYGYYIHHYWNPTMQALGLSYRPHDCRHTCISLLTAAGVDGRIIRRIVGHSATGVTEAVYTHFELPVLLEAINKI